MLGLLSQVATDLRQPTSSAQSRNNGLYGRSSSGQAMQQQPQTFFGRVLRESQRGAQRPLKGEWGGLLLANTLLAFRAVAMFVLGLRGNRGDIYPRDDSRSLLNSIYYGDAPEFHIANPGAIGSVLMIHASSAVGDIAALACDIGRSWRMKTALGANIPIEVILAGSGWQENNRSVQSAVRLRLTLNGTTFTRELARDQIEINCRQRTRLYESLGFSVNFQDPGVTFAREPLDAMVDHFCQLTRQWSGKVVDNTARENHDVAFLEHLADASGRRDNKIPSLSGDWIWYYLVQSIVQARYLGKNFLKCAPLSERNFDASHRFDLGTGRWFENWPSTQGQLCRMYDPQYQLRGKEVLPYNGLSGDVIARAERGTDIANAIRGVIPMDPSDQTIDEIAAIFKDTQTLHVNRLMTDMISFLLLCQHQQPSIMSDACRDAGVAGGMEELLTQLGGNGLADGWHEAVELDDGQPIRDCWTQWFNSLDPASESKPCGTPPHLWFACQTQWGDVQCGRLARLVDVTRKYYRAVTV